SDANAAAEELRALRRRAVGSDSAASVPPPAVAALERELLTPPIRYSRPGLLSHITYLYGMTLGADQPVSRDAAARYVELRRRLDDVRRRLRSLP
ncbi:MAG: hypothetical protein HOQ31_07950, partial [Gemmatimonadaceae bacterium]|nr:hypothetical protein [Gemmatimonadaceae bacterium]